MPNTVPAFANCLPSLLLTAAVCQYGCKPVSEDLFLVDSTSIAQGALPASDPAAAAAGNPQQPPAQGVAGGDAPPVPGGTRLPRNDAASFDWTETIPGAGVCKAGIFTGRFECQVGTIVGRPDVLDGVINLVLMGASESPTLNISGGSITVWDSAMQRVVIAPLTGDLECGSQRFAADIDPTLSDPMPLERQIAWFNPNAQPVTTGGLRGSLNPDLQKISGTIEILFDPQARCAGEFSITGSAR